MSSPDLPLFAEHNRLERDFQEFHAANPHVYTWIADQARRLKARGWDRYSTRTLISVLRFKHDISTERTDEWKINDHHSPYYARLIMARERDLAGFFETRETRAERDNDSEVC